jgi:tetratricopeptide (TPR) repeat protein
MANFHKNKWNSEDVKLAEDYFKKSLELDANHVASIVGLADVYSFMGMTGLMSFMDAWGKSNELVSQALILDPNNPGAYYQKANSSFFVESNFTKSLLNASKAIQLKPNYVEAQQFLCFLHLLSGNTEKAKEHLEIALGIDPLSQETLFYSAYFDYMTGDYSKSLIQLDSCLAVNPKNIPVHAVRSLCLLMLERYDEVIHYYDNKNVAVVEAEKAGGIALAYAFKKDKEKTEEYINLFKEQAKSPDGFTADSFLFMLYAVTDQIDEAFNWVQNGIKTKSTLLHLRFADPVVNALKLDKRYRKFHDIIFSTDIGFSAKKVKKSLLDEKATLESMTKLLDYILKEEPYLDPTLSLRSLAEKINLHPNQLSWLLNDNLGKSFNEFINSYRVEDAKRRLSSAEFDK